MGIENLGEVAKAAGISEETLRNAIESEESVLVELNNERVVYDSKEDFDTYINNVKKEASTASLEIAIKQARNDLGLDFQGKTMDNLLNAVKERTLEEAKIEPNKKIEELNNDLNSLRQQLQSKDEEFNQLQSNFKLERQEREINNRILNALPKEGTAIGQDDLLTLFKSQHNVELGEDGNVIVKKNGEVLKDKLMSPMGLEDVITNFTTPYIKKPEGGRGRTDEAGKPKAGTLDAFTSEMKDKGIEANTQEFNRIMAERMQEGTLSIE